MQKSRLVGVNNSRLVDQDVGLVCVNKLLLTMWKHGVGDIHEVCIVERSGQIFMKFSIWAAYDYDFGSNSWRF